MGAFCCVENRTLNERRLKSFKMNQKEGLSTSSEYSLSEKYESGRISDILD